MILIKNVKLIIFIIILMLSCNQSHADTPQKKIILQAFNIPPIFKFSKNGIPSGVGYELIAEIAKRENWDLTISEFPLDDLLTELQNNRNKDICVVYFLALSNKREKYLDFSNSSVLNVCSTLVTNRGNRLKKLADLRNQNIVTREFGLQAEVFNRMLDNLGIDCNIVRVKSDLELLDYTSKHPESIGLINNYTFHYYTSKYERYHDLESTLLVLPSFSVRYAVRKGMDGDVLQTINRYIKEWKNESDSPYSIIFDKLSQGESVDESIFHRLSTFELLIAPLVVILLLLWIVLLRYRIRVNIKKIKSKESDLEATIMSIGDGVLVIDVDGKAVNINPIATKLLQLNHANNSNILDTFILLNPQTLSPLKNPIEDILYKQSHLIQSGTCTLKNHKGNEYTINYTASPIYLENTLKGVVFVFKDITEEANNLEKIAQSERELSQMIESVNEAIFVYDTDFKLLRLNKIAKLLSVSNTGKPNIQNSKFATIICNSEPPCDDCPSVLAIKSKLPSTAEKVDPHGNTFLIKSTPVLDSDDKVTAVIEAVLDITELKKKEQELETSEKNYRMLVENQSDLLVKLNPAGKILFATKSCFDFFGVDESSFVDHSYMEFTVKKDREELLNIISGFSSSSKSKHTETHHQTPRGIRCLSWQLSAVYTSHNVIDYIIATGSDITDINLANEQLQHVQKLEAIGQLAGGIAHDFNNMLGGIVGYAELIIMKGESSDTIIQYCKHIIDTGEKAAELTQQLLTFARKGKASSTSFDAHSAIKRAINILKRSIKKNVSIELSLNAKNSMIIGDPTQIENAILNLAINARDAIGDENEGCFSIETTTIHLSEDYCYNSDFDIKSQEYILIKARDTGAGMSKEILKHIFEPFFTTKGIGKGTGLGLASIFGAVTSHSGAITAESEPGYGSVFDIFLPVISDAKTSQNSDTSTNILNLLTDKKNKVVLIIDDEEVIREVSKSLFEDMGYEVLLAKDGIEGLDIYDANKDIISFVVLDVIMPKMSGKATLKKLIELDPTAKVIIASGFAQSDKTEDFINLGAKAFIHKPYRQKELLNIIKDFYSP